MRRQRRRSPAGAHPPEGWSPSPKSTTLSATSTPRWSATSVESTTAPNTSITERRSTVTRPRRSRSPETPFGPRDRPTGPRGSTSTISCCTWTSSARPPCSTCARPSTRRSPTAHDPRCPRLPIRRPVQHPSSFHEGPEDVGVPLHPDRVPPPPLRGEQRRAGPGERVEHRLALDREHPDQPLGDRDRERGATTVPGPLRRPPNVGPDLAEPAVALHAGKTAPRPSRIVGGQTTERSLPEQQDVLAVEGHVGVGREEAGPEEGVRLVGRLLPEDVRKGTEPKTLRRHHRFGSVGPEAERPVGRAQCVPDVDRQDAPRYEDALALSPRPGENREHRRVVRRAEFPEQRVPLRDHRIGRGGDDEMDGFGVDAVDMTRVPLDEAHRSDWPFRHRRPFRCDRLYTDTPFDRH